MKVLITGATGMIGRGVLIEALQSENISEVISIGRRTIELDHSKLTQVTHGDFSDLCCVLSF